MIDRDRMGGENKIDFFLSYHTIRVTLFSVVFFLPINLHVCGAVVVSALRLTLLALLSDYSITQIFALFLPPLPSPPPASYCLRHDNDQCGLGGGHMFFSLSHQVLYCAVVRAFTPSIPPPPPLPTLQFTSNSPPFPTYASDSKALSARRPSPSSYPSACKAKCSHPLPPPTPPHPPPIATTTQPTPPQILDFNKMQQKNKAELSPTLTLFQKTVFIVFWCNFINIAVYFFFFPFSSPFSPLFRSARKTPSKPR